MAPIRDMSLSSVSLPAASHSAWWKDGVANSHRAIVFSLVNSSDIALRLDAATLGDGAKWALEPSTIPAQGRETVAFFSRSLGDADATFQWSIENCDKALVLICSNPYFGESLFNSQCPEHFHVGVQMKERRVTGAVVSFGRKISRLGSVDSVPLALEDVEEMEWADLVLGSSEKVRGIQSGRDTEGEAPLLKLLCVPCSLLPPALAAGNLEHPQRRTAQLAKLMENAPFNVLCLQEVFWSNARDILRQSLVRAFPHIIDRAGKETYTLGVQSGLFVASKFPIEWHQFFPFPEGIGSDSFATKGVLLVQLKVGKFRVYLVVTDMQSDPDDSIPWRLVGNGKVRAMQVRIGQAEMIARIVCQNVREREKAAGSSSIGAHACVVFAGKLQVAVEKRVRIEQETWALSSLVPHLADLLNGGQITALYASELLQELRARGFHTRFLGNLRAVTTDRRARSLMLIAMIGRVIQQELWLKMREKGFASPADEEKFYVNMCLAYLELIIGLPSTSSTLSLTGSGTVLTGGDTSPQSPGRAATTTPGRSTSPLPPPTSSAGLAVSSTASNQAQASPPKISVDSSAARQDGSNSNNSSSSNLSFRRGSSGGSTPSPGQSPGLSRADGSSSTTLGGAGAAGGAVTTSSSSASAPLILNNLWDKPLVRAILRMFGAGALSEDEVASGGSTLKAQVVWFQLSRYVQFLLGVQLDAKTELELLNKGPRRLVFSEDVVPVEGAELMKKLTTPDVLEDEQLLVVEKTDDFVSLSKVLGTPHDVFRELNPQDFGADVPPVVAQIIGAEQTRKDVVLVYDALPDGEKLHKVSTVHCARVVLKGEGGAVTESLTSSSGIETVLSFGAESDGFVIV